MVLFAGVNLLEAKSARRQELRHVRVTQMIENLAKAKNAHCIILREGDFARTKQSVTGHGNEGTSISNGIDAGRRCSCDQVSNYESS